MLSGGLDSSSIVGLISQEFRGELREPLRTEFRDKYGVAAARMEAVGLGANRPLVVTADQQDEPRNRRVQVTNIGG